MAETLQKVYGIDLGTTYSCVAIVDDAGKPVVLRNFDNEAITPSVVFFDGDNVVVGTEAKRNSRLEPQNVVELVKRSMGDANWFFEHNGKKYRPEEISALILRKLVADVEQTTAEKVTDVVITCPAYFGVNQREATAAAGKIAGLNVRSIINEPTAAAISYGMDQANDQVVLVYDLGGGTFDITMILVKEKEIRVVCTGGDHNLGGKDWDMGIIKHLSQVYQEQTGSSEDILDNPETLQDLYLQAEDSKKSLTTRDHTRLKVTHGAEPVRTELTREKFDELTNGLLEATITLTNKMLAEAKQKGHSRFDKILLVGGSTRMPQVAERLKNEFSVECEMFDPDESVAKGAAIFGWKLALDDEIRIAVAEQTGQDVDEVDLEKVGDAAVVDAQQQVASKFSLPERTVEKASGTKIRNVTSKTFGIKALNENRVEVVFNLIKRNDQVPADIAETFGTVDDNQATVDVRLMENLDLSTTTDPLASTEIGKAEMPLPPGLKAGAPIHVNFRLNDQGRLEVTATEPTSNQTVQIEVETASVMSTEEIEQAKSKGLALQVS